jgi:hypothetical protein
MSKKNTELFVQYFIRIIIICGQCSLYFYYIYIIVYIYIHKKLGLINLVVKSICIKGYYILVKKK